MSNPAYAESALISDEAVSIGNYERKRREVEQERVRGIIKPRLDSFRRKIDGILDNHPKLEPGKLQDAGSGLTLVALTGVPSAELLRKIYQSGQVAIGNLMREFGGGETFDYSIAVGRLPVSDPRRGTSSSYDSLIFFGDGTNYIDVKLDPNKHPRVDFHQFPRTEEVSSLSALLASEPRVVAEYAPMVVMQALLPALSHGQPNADFAKRTATIYFGTPFR